jgi:L-alanine-DL-glutamate epimerase-like enolase superfamily enzyme
MRIAAVTSRAYRLPLAEAWVSAKYRITHHEYVITEIVTDDGRRGTGWCQTIGVGALSVAALVQSYLAGMVIGEDPRNTERIWSALWEDCHFAGPSGISTLAIATIDIALWDLKAQAANMPLHRLIGGMRDEVGVYASAVNLHLSEDALLAQVEEHLAAGYAVFKIKIGRNAFDEDLARARAVRKAIGQRRALMLDVNQRWSAGLAVSRLHALRELSPDWIEEPLLSDDVRGHALVRAQGGVPVAVGEQLGNRFDFWNYIVAEAVDILQPNVWKVGGITEWLKIAHLAQNANLPVAPHNSLELSRHLVAGVQNGLMVENIFGGNLSDLGVVEEPVTIERGRTRIPGRPGHGVVFRQEVLDRYVLAPGQVVERKPSTHAGL